MKELITMLLLSFSCVVTRAQKLIISEYDKSNKVYLIETKSIPLRQDPTVGLSFGMRSIGQQIFVKLEGYNYVETGVNEGQEVVFLLADNSSATAYSRKLQTTSRYTGGQKFSFEYEITKTELEKLLTGKVFSIRFYDADGFADADIRDRNPKEINQAVKIFLTEFKAKLTETQGF